MYGHIRSKIPNIVELGQIYAWYLSRWSTSSTDGATDNSPTLGCLGLAPSRLSKQWGIDILPIFPVETGV